MIHDKGPWRILCVTDSLGLEAARDQPADGPHVSYLSITEQLLHARRVPITFAVDALTGRTAPAVLRHLHDHYAGEEGGAHRLLWIQAGIVDCAPRLLSNFSRALVGKVRPIPLRDRIFRLLSLLHLRWVFRLGHARMVTPHDFRYAVRAILDWSQAKGFRHCFVAGILPTTFAKERTYVGLAKNILEYNQVLAEESSREGVSFVDFVALFGPNPDQHIYDGVHPNYQGKRRMAELAATQVENALAGRGAGFAGPSGQAHG